VSVVPYDSVSPVQSAHPSTLSDLTVLDCAIWDKLYAQRKEGRVSSALHLMAL